MIDTHAHLNSSALYEKRGALMDEAKKAGVNIVVNIGSDVKSSLQAVEISDEFKNAYAVVGFHPHEARHYNKKNEQAIKELATSNKKVVAIGEIGLDFHYNFSNKKAQIRGFKRQIKLADKLNLPIVLHSRNATETTLKILKRKKKFLNNGGIIHCFGDGKQVARQFLSLGFVLGIGGLITFKNSTALKEAVLDVGIDNIVLETDSPYIAPVPVRGRENQPANLKYVCEYLANLFGLSVKQVASKTSENAKRVYRI